MGRVCYGPSLSWAEFVMDRVVQLPICVLCLATLFTLVSDRKKNYAA